MPVVVNGNEAMALHFDENKELEMKLRGIKNIKWSRQHNAWYLPVLREYFEKVKTVVKECAEIDSGALKNYLEQKKIRIPTAKVESKIKKVQVEKILTRPLSDENLEALRRFMEQLKLKSYSASTMRTYRGEFLALLQILKKKAVSDLSTEDIRRYFVYCADKLGLSENSLHSRINAVKFYFEQVLYREKMFIDIPRPKKPLLLPNFFNQDEVASIINATQNIKHKVMLMLAYSAGMRVSEVATIRTKNIDSKRMTILIERAKGKKDRIVTLSPILLVMLREYWKKHKPSKSSYLFPGQTEGQPYSTRSLQLILQDAKEKAGIYKKGSMHALRHSFATHLLDKGTDVTMIMKLLGHNDIKTTLRYLHVTNRDLLQIISPLDELKLNL